MKIKLCCFCEKWESGGIESFLNNVLTRLPAERFEIDVVAARLTPSVFTGGMKKQGIRFIQLSGNLHALKANYQMFRELLRENHYDAVYLNLFQGLSLYYAKIACEEGVPVRIAHSHNTALRKTWTRPLKLVIHYIARTLFGGYATERWACSQNAAAFLFGKTKEFSFIPNGIETERFRFDAEVRDTMRRELGMTDSFVVGCVGRLCDQKNQSFLLDAFAEMKIRRPDCRLLMIGEGEKKEELEEKAARLGISGQVVFCGVTDHVERFMWAMDVLAFPSLFEGLGIVAVEAQAAGLPVVASEYVPEEAAATGLMQRCSIESAEKWADILLHVSCGCREEGCALVRAAGFEIDDVAGEIEGSLEERCLKRTAQEAKT